MILDQSSEMADALPVEGEPGVYLIGSVIDTSNRDAENIWLSITIEDAFAGEGAAATFVLASDENPDIATDGSASVHYAAGPIAAETLVRGAMLSQLIQSDGSMKKYLGILLVVSGATLTAGAINACLVLGISDWRASPSQFS